MDIEKIGGGEQAIMKVVLRHWISDQKVMMLLLSKALSPQLLSINIR